MKHPKGLMGTSASVVRLKKPKKLEKLSHRLVISKEDMVCIVCDKIMPSGTKVWWSIETNKAYHFLCFQHRAG